MHAKGQFVGRDARIDFEKMADNPIFGSGGYLLLRGQAPKGMFLVSPAKKTFSKLKTIPGCQTRRGPWASFERYACPTQLGGWAIPYLSTETIIGDPGAERLLSRAYRAPYQLPA